MKTIFLIITMLFMTMSNTVAYENKPEIAKQVEMYVVNCILFKYPNSVDVKAKLIKLVNYRALESMAAVNIEYKDSNRNKIVDLYWIKVEHTIQNSQGNFTITNLSKLTDKDIKNNPGLYQQIVLISGN